MYLAEYIWINNSIQNSNIETYIVLKEYFVVNFTTIFLQSLFLIIISK